MPPVVALTSGESAGVGPELAQAAWMRVKDVQPFFIIADVRCFKRSDGSPKIVEISDPADAVEAVKVGLPVMPCEFPSPADPGHASLDNAQATIDTIRLAAQMAIRGDVGAICTNPINKRVLIDGAGFKYPGHTEFLADICGARQSAMMLACADLKVVPVTTHLPLSAVPSALNQECLEFCMRASAESMRRDFGVSKPRVAVAGLNPHAGESGAFGDEEKTIIEPVLERLRAEGFRVSGPLPADTMFCEEARSNYDVAVCMYHDQALIPVKTLDFYGSVNITLGLPIIRVSPAHGTALNIAGRGIANPQSLINALLTAGRMARARGGMH